MNESSGHAIIVFDICSQGRTGPGEGGEFPPRPLA